MIETANKSVQHLVDRPQQGQQRSVGSDAHPSST